MAMRTTTKIRNKIRKTIRQSADTTWQNTGCLVGAVWVLYTEVCFLIH